jgi:hypothetical protein
MPETNYEALHNVILTTLQLPAPSFALISRSEVLLEKLLAAQINFSLFWNLKLGFSVLKSPSLGHILG